MPRRLSTLLMLVLMVAAVGADAARWDRLKNDGCSGWAKRQYSSRLLDTRGDWDDECRATAVTIGGKRYSRPSRCDNHGLGGMWGIWFVDDASCAARWDSPKRDHCTASGVRQYSAILRDIPGGTTWESACRRTAIAIGGANQGTPDRCDNHGIGGMWGVWSVNDPTCGARWDTPKADRCTGKGQRQYSAILRDVPSDETWEVACAKTSIAIQGADLGTPDRCDNHGIGGMWGVWKSVPDDKCTKDDRSAEEQTRAKFEENEAVYAARHERARADFAATVTKIDVEQTILPDSDREKLDLMARRLDDEEAGVGVVTLMSGGSGAIVVGYGHAEGYGMRKRNGGAAVGPYGQYECRKVWSNTFTAGIALGFSAVLELGEWFLDFDSLAAEETNGVQASFGPVAVVWSKGIHWSATSGEVAGITVVNGGGAGFELASEYVHGWTGVSDEETPCEEATWR